MLSFPSVLSVVMSEKALEIRKKKDEISRGKVLGCLKKIRDFFSYTHRENNKAYDPKHYQLENIGERYSDAP